MNKIRKNFDIPQRQRQYLRRRRLQRFVFIVLAFLVIIFLKTFFYFDMKYFNEFFFLSETLNDKRIIADYSINLEKLRNNLEPRCSCHQDDSVCVSLDELSNYKIYHTKNLTLEFEFKMGKFEFEYSLISCNPFNVLRRGLEQKIISYSVDNLDLIRLNHLKTLIRSVKKYYPSWIIRVYHKGNIDIEIICELECLQDEFKQNYDNIDFCDVTQMVFRDMNVTHLPGPFWGWLPIGEHFVDAFLSRDLDACIGEREAVAVNQWMESNYPFHVIRDRPTHVHFIEPYLWGFQTKKRRQTSNAIFFKLTDQNKANWHMMHYLDHKNIYEQSLFFNDIQQAVRNNLLVHASYNCDIFEGEFLKSFPSKRTAQYCLDNLKGYGCCENFEENDYYSSQKAATNNKNKFCPKQCRPKNQKAWFFC